MVPPQAVNGIGAECGGSVLGRADPGALRHIIDASDQLAGDLVGEANSVFHVAHGEEACARVGEGGTRLDRVGGVAELDVLSGEVEDIGEVFFR